MVARKAWLALKTPVTMLLLLGFVLLAALWGWTSVKAPIPPVPPEPCIVKKLGPAFKPENAVVQIYNASEVNGLAKKVKIMLSADGFRVTKAVNTEEGDPRTDFVHITGIAANSPEVVLVRSYFDKKATFAADPLKVDHSVNVYVGKDFRQLARRPLKSVPLKNGQACVPPPSTTKAEPAG